MNLFQFNLWSDLQEVWLLHFLFAINQKIQHQYIKDDT